MAEKKETAEKTAEEKKADAIEHLRELLEAEFKDDGFRIVFKFP